MVTTGMCILLCVIALVVGANIGLLAISLIAMGKEKKEGTDVVKVIRCRDCKHCKEVEDLIFPITHFFCSHRPTDFSIKLDHYCGYGERNDEE